MPIRQPLDANDHAVMNVFLFRSTPKLWMQIAPFVLNGFFLFHCNPVSDRPWIPPYSSHLPGDFDPRLVSFDRESVVSDFLRHNCLGKLTNHSQLVAKILIYNFKVIRQSDSGLTIDISRDIAVVDIEHVRRLDEGVA
jgi:hypothetical protein